MRTELLNILKRFSKYRILLIGDLILDRYIQGACNRIAPEASVPVIDVYQEDICLGGAANVAVNLSSLGSEVLFCTVTGNDLLTETVSLFKEHRLDENYMITMDNRKTLMKTRIRSENQLIVRFDKGTNDIIDESAERKLINKIIKAYEVCDAVLIADYDKGVITDNIIYKLQELQLKYKKPLAIDAKCYRKYKILKPDLIKPNYQEALKILNDQPVLDRKSQVINWAKRLFEQTGAQNTVLTMDEDGIVYFRHAEMLLHHQVKKVSNPQVSGAGDSFISTCFLSVLAGAKFPDAISIAAHAAHLAIQSKRTAVCSVKDLSDDLAGCSKILSLSQLKKLLKIKRTESIKIVFTNGCFDILHSGHVKYLTKAKEKGDILIVGVNNDESIKRLKGAARPINRLAERIEVLSGLACIDYIVTFGGAEDDTPIRLIKELRPDIFVKGGDYSHKYLPEHEIIEKISCRLEFIPFIENKSTSNTIRKIQDSINIKTHFS